MAVASQTTAITNESVGTGNGTTTTFAHTAANLYVIPGTVTVTAGAVTGTDDTNGNITGTGVGGTIDYVTGAVNLTFTTAPANAVAITMNYQYTNPTATVQAMGIDQIPTLSESNVFVVVQ